MSRHHWATGSQELFQQREGSASDLPSPGSPTGQSQSNDLGDENEDHRGHQALPQPTSVSFVPSGRPHPLSLPPAPLVTGLPPTPTHFLVPFPRNQLAQQEMTSQAPFLTASPNKPMEHPFHSKSFLPILKESRVGMIKLTASGRDRGTASLPGQVYSQGLASQR